MLQLMASNNTNFQHTNQQVNSNMATLTAATDMAIAQRNINNIGLEPANFNSQTVIFQDILPTSSKPQLQTQYQVQNQNQCTSNYTYTTPKSSQVFRLPRIQTPSPRQLPQSLSNSQSQIQQMQAQNSQFVTQPYYQHPHHQNPYHLNGIVSLNTLDRTSVSTNNTPENLQPIPSVSFEPYIDSSRRHSLTLGTLDRSITNNDNPNPNNVINSKYNVPPPQGLQSLPMVRTSRFPSTNSLALRLPSISVPTTASTNVHSPLKNSHNNLDNANEVEIKLEIQPNSRNNSISSNSTSSVSSSGSTSASNSTISLINQSDALRSFKQQHQQVQPPSASSSSSSSYNNNTFNPGEKYNERGQLIGKSGKLLRNTKRAAQNRNAQKAFRQRRELYIKDLETKAKIFDSIKKENEDLKTLVDFLKKKLQNCTNNNNINESSSSPRSSTSATDLNNIMN
ncbi:Cin5p NDAI_0F00900 [Naumovozyma dairenensis CBS 421]|uniref:BZIP domain-containing protein n=1 Tax=Naumovozyma dairenensis (strain ATCC 10597 / BCRC 20456 / CBS 421 / NBRC 0211 / NRRL Y-12639) TaxID=1071378 RepID=G0WC98_NAUDC|nr:hypothetical protein NDAI_0F00900 [Naumovozyma dairenensis CBS 421]CCD25409.1 hypothetical protein NDAI_0F00900 [Naumovozyma dairenensis CBS 421]